MSVSGLVPSGTLVIPPHLLRAGTGRATLTLCFYTWEETDRITRNDEWRASLFKMLQKEAAEQMSGFAVGGKLTMTVGL